jgi:probable phosphoglycerate mutase
MTVVIEMTFVCHGEAHCDLAGLMCGIETCRGLTPRGHEQVSALAGHLNRHQRSSAPFVALYSAPIRCVEESADVLSRALGLPSQTDSGLCGLRPGKAEGCTWRSIENSFEGMLWTYPTRQYAEGSETWGAFVARSTACLARIHQRHSAELGATNPPRVLIVCQAEVIQSAFMLTLSLRPSSVPQVRLISGHASLTCWRLNRDRFGDESWALVGANDRIHLITGTP